MKTFVIALALLAATLPVHAQKAASLKDQAICDAQAHKRADEQKELWGTSTIIYSSHFDPKTNVCYVSLETLTLDLKAHRRYAQTEISDAFERKEYASAFMTYGTGAPTKPDHCYVMPRGEQYIECESDREFLRLVEKYFGL